jgi:hypothetical protein
MKMAKKKTNNHGGSRPGTGRRLGIYDDPIRVCVVLPRKLWGLLDRHAVKNGQNRNRLIVETMQSVLSK